MTDLKSPFLIYAKGILFLTLGFLAGGILLAMIPRWDMAALLVITIWSFCRFYYFAFYVIEKYVDPEERYSGLIDFASRMIKTRK